METVLTRHSAVCYMLYIPAMISSLQLCLTSGSSLNCGLYHTCYTQKKSLSTVVLAFLGTQNVSLPTKWMRVDIKLKNSAKQTDKTQLFVITALLQDCRDHPPPLTTLICERVSLSFFLHEDHFFIACLSNSLQRIVRRSCTSIFQIKRKALFVFSVLFHEKDNFKKQKEKKIRLMH